MSRHNRRRTRGGHKAKSSRSSIQDRYGADPLAQDPQPPDEAWSSQLQPFTVYRTQQGSPSFRYAYLAPYANYEAACTSAAYALGLSHGYTMNSAASRPSESRDRDWVARDTEDDRKYGKADPNGTDEGLCKRMQEYFDGLDFI